MNGCGRTAQSGPLTPRKSARIKSHPALLCCYEVGAPTRSCARNRSTATRSDLILRTGEEKTAGAQEVGIGDYSSLIEVTFNVSPCISPLTSTRRWSFLSDALSASTILVLPSASNLRNCLSFVKMPKPLAAHFSAQARGWESGSAATFLEQLASTTGTSL